MLTTTKALITQKLESSQSLPTPTFDGVVVTGAQFGSISLSVLFSSGADVFYDVAGNSSAPTYGGTAMTLLSSVGVGGNGRSLTFNRYRIAGAGTGKPKTLAMSGPGFIEGIVYAVRGVTSVSATQTDSGTGWPASTTVTASSGLIIQSFCAFTYALNNIRFTTPYSGGTLAAVAGSYAGSRTISWGDGSAGNATFTANKTTSTEGWASHAHVLT